MRAELFADRPYCDPELFCKNHTYGSFVREPVDRGMLRFRPRDASGPAAALDISLERTKNGTSIAIFGTRYFNTGLKASPSTELPSGARFESLDVDSGDIALLAHAAVNNCAYGRFEPDSLAQRLTTPAFDARRCGITEVGGVGLSATSVVGPSIVTSPFRGSWTLSLCQRCVGKVVERNVGLDRVSVDRHPGVDISKRLLRAQPSGTTSAFSARCGSARTPWWGTPLPTSPTLGCSWAM